MTPRTGVLLATLLVGAAGVYGCNAIFGIEDVTLAKDAGPDATADAPGMDAAADTGVDATLVDAGMEAAADTGIDAGMEAGADTGIVDAGMEAAPMPCADAADFLFDPRNCGACGHDCLRGACDGGQCQPFLLTSATYASGLALGQGMVYLVDSAGRKVTAFPTDGGPSGPAYAEEELTATVAGGMVYLGSASGSVSSCTPNFMACGTSLWAGSVNATAMTSDDSGVYWGTSAGAAGSMVYALAPLTGSAVALAMDLDAGDGGISGIATDAIYVYFVGGGSIWRIAKLADAGTTPDLVGYDYINLRAVVPLASALYFTDESGSVNLLPVEDGGYGTFNTFAGGLHWAPVGLAVDAQRLYWANYTPDSGILACAPNPAGCAGEPAVVAAMPYTEWVLADDASVYFTTRIPDPGMLDDNNGAFYQVVK